VPPLGGEVLHPKSDGNAYEEVAERRPPKRSRNAPLSGRRETPDGCGVCRATSPSKASRWQ